MDKKETGSLQARLPVFCLLPKNDVTEGRPIKLSVSQDFQGYEDIGLLAHRPMLEHLLVHPRIIHKACFPVELFTNDLNLDILIIMQSGFFLRRHVDR